MFKSFQRVRKLNSLYALRTGNLRTDAGIARENRIAEEKRKDEPCQCPLCSLKRALQVADEMPKTFEKFTGQVH